MAHAIWSGTINFGLVTIPVKLMTAVRESADVHFHFLHAKDSGRIQNQRACSVCGKNVNWGDIVRGYEYEKGEYVVMSDEDFKKAAVEATQSIEIEKFVDATEVDPMLADKPYFLEPEKKGRHAYALLREALEKSGKVGIARVVIRTREHLAVLKPSGDALMIELLHWKEELVDPSSLDLPKAVEKVPAPQMKAALMLIETMASTFDPAEYTDTYRDKLLEVIHAKAKGGPAPKTESKPRPTSKVVDLVEVLRRSLEEQKKKGPMPKAPLARTKGGPKRPSAKKSAA